MNASESAVSTISATVTQTSLVITNTVVPTISRLRDSATSQFDWVTFFWGGALGSFIGALIILSIERILDAIIEKRKVHQEEKQITHALDKEIQTNIDICTQLITTLTGSGSIIAFTKPESIWLQIYCNKYIDFTNSDSIRLYSNLYRTKNLIEIIHDLQSNQQMFTATSRALSNFGNIVTDMNRNISDYANRLKTVLEDIQRRRVGNKMIDNTDPNPQIIT